MSTIKFSAPAGVTHVSVGTGSAVQVSPDGTVAVDPQYTSALAQAGFTRVPNHNGNVLVETHFYNNGGTIPTSANIGFPVTAHLVKTSGSPAAAFLSAYAPGAIRLTIDNTSEKQAAALYNADTLSLDTTVGFVMITKVRVPTLPASATSIGFGVTTAYADGLTGGGVYEMFKIDNGGTVEVLTYDGTTTGSLNTTGIVKAGEWHTFTLDATANTGVVFSMDGSALATVPVVAPSGTIAVQPFFDVFKASGTTTGTLDVDSLIITF